MITNQFIGQAFEELSTEEMEVLQGAGEITPYSTIPCAAIISAVWATITKC
ncbi:lichenicidin A2 family type 2 lantibiotic [Carnobacterium divergens]|uniref:lichenicidin A2 family type 2 lantibiotic n=1 Tax=Carnobacterium divergens TaxID=2748 RepID=UPI0010718DED|nr:lichenicidin A2 family type 2 lantibiotic [Carnobacterium divergens]TFI76356.1 hypothetical protein CKN81_00145 [Carnobacterium divergens]